MSYYRLISSMLKATVSTLLTGLYAVYKGESNANDSLGLRNGTAVGGLTYSAGKSGNAFDFNGTNAVVSLPNNSMNLTGDFSISCWVNMASVAGIQVYLSTYQNTDGVDYGFIFRFINDFKFTFFNGATRIDTNTSGGGSMLTNTWYHVVVTKTSSQIKWYINGVADNVFNGTYNITYHPTSNNAGIGALYKYDGTNTAQYMSNGSKIDEVNVWSRVLTSTEVTTLYNTGTGKFYPTF
jgi:hypothetical protein